MEMSKIQAMIGLGMVLATVAFVAYVPNVIGADITAPAENQSLVIGAAAPLGRT